MIGDSIETMNFVQQKVDKKSFGLHKDMKITIFFTVLFSLSTHAMQSIKASRALGYPYILLHDSHNFPGVSQKDPFSRTTMGKYLQHQLRSSQRHWMVAVENYLAAPQGNLIRKIAYKHVNIDQISDEFTQDVIETNDNIFVSLERRNILTLLKVLVALNIKLKNTLDPSILADIAAISDAIGDVSFNDIFGYFIGEIESDIISVSSNYLAKQELHIIKTKMHHDIEELKFFLMKHGYADSDFYRPLLDLISEPHERAAVLLKVLFHTTLDSEIFSPIIESKALASFVGLKEDVGFFALTGYVHGEKLQNMISSVKGTAFETIDLCDTKDWSRLQTWFKD
jgi:hypothetical protein